MLKLVHHKLTWSLFDPQMASSSLQSLQVVLGLDQFVDLVDEVVLGLGHDSLDFVDLLVHNLVDLFHVVEHLVRLVIQSIKLPLVVLELDLATEHLLARGVLFYLHLDLLQDLLLVRIHLRCVQVRVLVLPVVVGDCLLAFNHYGTSELLDIPREGLS